MLRVGIIAEDESDIKTSDELLRKIASKNYQIKPVVAHGCGQIVRKVLKWCELLDDRGCRALIVLHDLDEKVQVELRRKLEDELRDCPIARWVVVIPVREIEAWLLADHEAIRKALNLRVAISRISNPESIMDPKKKLGQLVYEKSGKRVRYVNTIHNARIAAKCEVAQLRRCASFIPFLNFATTVLR